MVIENEYILSVKFRNVEVLGFSLDGPSLIANHFPTLLSLTFIRIVRNFELGTNISPAEK